MFSTYEIADKKFKSSKLLNKYFYFLIFILAKLLRKAYETITGNFLLKFIV